MFWEVAICKKGRECGAYAVQLRTLGEKDMKWNVTKSSAEAESGDMQGPRKGPVELWEPLVP
jgi:hypothetical protein